MTKIVKLENKTAFFCADKNKNVQDIYHGLKMVLTYCVEGMAEYGTVFWPGHYSRYCYSAPLHQPTRGRPLRLRHHYCYCLGVYASPPRSLELKNRNIRQVAERNTLKSWRREVKTAHFIEH